MKEKINNMLSSKKFPVISLEELILLFGEDYGKQIVRPKSSTEWLVFEDERLYYMEVMKNFADGKWIKAYTDNDKEYFFKEISDSEIDMLLFEKRKRENELHSINNLLSHDALRLKVILKSK